MTVQFKPLAAMLAVTNQSRARERKPMETSRFESVPLLLKPRPANEKPRLLDSNRLRRKYDLYSILSRRRHGPRCNFSYDDEMLAMSATSLGEYSRKNAALTNVVSCCGAPQTVV